jgi:diguanylate cyclase (GGDEF)-like protein
MRSAPRMADRLPDTVDAAVPADPAALGAASPEPLIPPLLQDLTAVAAAVIDLDGCWLEGNSGFWFLLDRDEPLAIGEPVDRWFVQPTFPEIVAATAEDGQAFTGNLTVGDIMRTVRTLKVRILRHGDRLLLLGEHDVAELERLSATVLTLNDELSQTQRELVRANRKLEWLTQVDPLTGAANRRSFDVRADDMAKRDDQTTDDAILCTGLIMADIDFFKRVNDTYGHAVGDDALVGFVDVIRANVRRTDLVARLGGEEFCVLLPQSGAERAIAVAERIRAAFETTELKGIDGRLTASFGVACRRLGEPIREVLARADSALYRAKEGGRNRVETARGDACNAAASGVVPRTEQEPR